MKIVDRLPARADAVVIGGGVIGAATAFFLSRAGVRPLIVERRPHLCTLTTAVAGGGYRLQQDNEEDLRLVAASVELFRSFGELTGQRRYDPGLRPQGYLWVTRTAQGAARQRHLVEAQRSWGLDDVDVLDGDEARKRFPFLGGDALQVRFRGGDGFLEPKAVAMGFVEGSDGEVAIDCPVVGLEPRSQGLTVRTGRGEVAAGAVIIAAGPFSGIVAALAGADLPITTVRRQRLVMPEVSEVPQDAPMTIDEETGGHWRPALRGATLFFTDPTTAPSPPAEDVPLDHSFVFDLLDPGSPTALAAVAPFWRRVWERWSDPWILQAGQYTMTPDRRPLIGALGHGLFVNSGYCGHGVMCSAAGARHLAEVLTGAVRDEDNPYHPDRDFTPREHLDLL